MKNELSKRETLYLNIMKSKVVLYIKGRPGEAKSAIGKSIADKSNYNYLTLSLSQMNEVDLGQFPFTEKLSNGITQVNFASPSWATNANSNPTIIHFEELNRCRTEVASAALLILNEKMVGNLKLNDNVLMMASGNLGDVDGTDVNELDSATINRLFIYTHELPLTEWKNQYANKNVLSTIISFLNAKPEHFYKFANEEGEPFSTPRSWTNLSNYLKRFGKLTLNEIYSHIQEVGYGFIGNSAISFARWLEDTMTLSINDIVHNYSQLNVKINELSRHKISELLTSLKTIILNELDDNMMNNVISFISDIHNINENQDEVTGYLLNVIDEQISDDFKNTDNTSKLLNKFKNILNEIDKDYNE